MKPWPLNGARCYLQRKTRDHCAQPANYFSLPYKLAIGLLTWFSRHNCQTHSKSPNIKSSRYIALNLLVSLFRCLVARGGRKHGNRRTDRQKNLRTKYRNPRCACAPRVNAVFLEVYTNIHFVLFHVFHRLCCTNKHLAHSDMGQRKQVPLTLNGSTFQGCRTCRRTILPIHCFTS